MNKKFNFKRLSIAIACYFWSNMAIAATSNTLLIEDSNGLLSSLLVQNQMDERSESEYILEVTKLNPDKEAEFKELSKQKSQIRSEIDKLRSQGTDLDNVIAITQKSQQLNQIKKRLRALYSKSPVITEKNVIGTEFRNPLFITVRLDKEGAKEFAQLTKEIAGTGIPFFILINGEVVDQPLVAEEFSTGIIGGLFVIRFSGHTPTQAEEIAAEILERALSYGMTPEREAEQLIKTANRQSKQQQYQAAIENYDRAINLDPMRTDAYLAQAEIHLLKKDFQATIPLYEQLISLKPESIENVMPSLLKSYLKIGDRQKASVLLERRAKIEPSFADNASVGQAMLLLSLGDFEQAIDKFDKAIELRTIQYQKNNSGSSSKAILGNFALYWWRGLTQEHLNQQKEAISNFQMVKDIEIDFLLSNLESSRPNAQKIKQTARIFYIQSLACERLEDEECTSKNRNIVKDLLEYRDKEEVVAKFKIIDNTFSRLLDNSTQILEGIAR